MNTGMHVGHEKRMRTTMISHITLIVEHDDTTDDITDFVQVVSTDNLDGAGNQWLENFGFDFKVIDYTVDIDVPDPIKDIQELLKPVGWDK